MNFWKKSFVTIHIAKRSLMLLSPYTETSINIWRLMLRYCNRIYVHLHIIFLNKKGDYQIWSKCNYKAILSTFWNVFFWTIYSELELNWFYTTVYTDISNLCSPFPPVVCRCICLFLRTIVYLRKGTILFIIYLHLFDILNHYFDVNFRIYYEEKSMMINLTACCTLELY